jgi:ABC-2 type transport system permease protein
MIAQIRAELLKIRSTRTALGLILGMIALILLFTLLTGLLTHPSGLASGEDQRQLLSLGSLADVFSAPAGVLLVTSEYRFGTIRPTILFNPERSHVLAAKVVAGALAGIAFGVLAEAVGWAIGCAILDGRGITVVLSSGDILLLTLGGLAGAALWGAIGAGLGAIIHPHVGGVITLLAGGGPRRRRSPVRPRPLGRAVHANPCYGRTDGPPSRSPGLARRRRDHVDRLGRRTGGCRYRPIRSAGHQLTAWVTACAH